MMYKELHKPHRVLEYNIIKLLLYIPITLLEANNNNNSNIQ